MDLAKDEEKDIEDLEQRHSPTVLKDERQKWPWTQLLEDLALIRKRWIFGKSSRHMWGMNLQSYCEENGALGEEINKDK